MKLLSKSILLLLIPIMTGCMGMGSAVVKPAAFAGNKTFALASISAMPIIEAPAAGIGIGISDALSAASNSEISHKADKIFDETEGQVASKLSHTGKFKLMSGSRVIRNRGYRRLKPDDNEGRLVAKGYTYINTPEKAARLAKSLGVDGVITVNFHFTMINGGGFGIGPLTVTSRHGATGIEVTAYNKEGVVIWKDNVYTKSDDGYTEPGTVTFNMEKLYPLLQASTATSFDEMVKRFKEKLG